MNNFHIYEVVGRSKHSVVYKGRQKKTIQYYGVKSVDKCQRPYILQEVKILHSVKHPNVMGFYSWYETTNHLWLILEYCVGGDLLTLLRQDRKLPETSIHDFGRDLLSALHALHSNGIVHCDLKPSNILLDENGRVKLGGFGLARTVADIVHKHQSKPSSLHEKNRRGTPCYMAPELLRGDVSCHSFASDVWALGCILYECAVGQPPFVSSSLNALVDAILHKEVHLPPNLSDGFRDLLRRCFQKDPVQRIGWKEIMSHPFWKTNLPFEKIPNQGIFLEVLKGCGYSADHGPACEKELAPISSDEGKENRDLVPINGKMKEDRANVLRLSRIAKKNLQSEGVDYGSISNDDSSDVKLDSADTELDFTEESTLVPADKAFPCEAESSTSADSNADPRDGEGEEESFDMHLESTAGSKADGRKRAIDRELSSSALDERSANGDGGEPVDLPNSINHNHLKDMNSTELAFHSSDLLVKPIVGNRRIEKKHEFQWDAIMLPFEPVTLQEMLELDQESLESFLSIIYKTVASSSSVSERLNALAYFGGLCKDSNSANILINSSLLHMFVTKLRGTKVANLKTYFAYVIGTLIRHATFIGEDVPKSGIIDALTESVRDKSEVVRRKSMAALGELLFYVVTQEQEETEGESQKPAWYVPNGTITTIFRLLRNVEDPVTQHYAVKTLENIFSIGGEWALRLGTSETALSLVHICLNAKSEHVKVTASSALARLYRCNTDKAQMITDKIGMRVIVGFLKEGNAKVQQHFGSIFILALASVSNKSKNALSDEQHLANTLMGLLDHASNVVCGKAIISIVEISKLQVQWFIQMSNAKLIGILERLSRVQDAYLSHSIAFFQASMPDIIERLVTQISSGVEKLCGRRSSAQRNRTYQSSSLSSLSQETNLGCKAFLAVVASSHFCLACAGRNAVPALVEMVQKLQKGPDTLVADIRGTIFTILEAMSQHGDILLSNPEDVLESLFPMLSFFMINSQSGDTRFLCAKMLCDMVLFYISEVYGGMELSGSAEQAKCHQIDGLLHGQIRESILPSLPALLEDEDPIPLYSLKMLIAILDFDADLAEKVADLGLLSSFISFLSLDHPNNNVHNLRLCKTMVGTAVVPLEELLSHGVVEKAASVLSYTCENMVEAFMEPSLELCFAIVERAVREGRREALETLAGTCMQKIKLLGKHSDLGVSELAGKCVSLLQA
ncbi:serine/threonine protein kinase [Chloropicon primus]|uniref:Serine/threonine protein kinase n=2 Tax=Chloropicon primus TaxID=1764295 RepID=A0A5B8MMC6_9CHLO|nr:serine/threonine protein kinase [Chloropicon primus]UPR00396.1 serine/threonine protein kinase [Chloropicon primus]|eukprot:QDZ21184.1 serine/threonine protein kinase [Chloropicon primus]